MFELPLYLPIPAVAPRRRSDLLKLGVPLP